MLKGIDISAHQRYKYKQVIDHFGTDFVICRAAFSKSVDGYCDIMYQYAKSKGKKLGFYFFPLTSDGTPEDCATWAVAQVKGYLNEAIPILDWEAYSKGHNVADTDWAFRWLEKFKALTGIKPMIYMNSSCEATYNWDKVVAGDYGLWIANYGNNDGSDHGRPITKHWKFAAMHQYTSLLDGQGLDGDTFYGDQAAWDAYACAKNPVKVNPAPTPAPVKKSNEEIADEVIAGKWGNSNERYKRLTEAGYSYETVQAIVNRKVEEARHYDVYTVKKGDTLSGIAKAYGVDWKKVAQDNRIQNASLIYPGQKLKIYK